MGSLLNKEPESIIKMRSAERIVLGDENEKDRGSLKAF